MQFVLLWSQSLCYLFLSLKVLQKTFLLLHQHFHFPLSLAITKLLFYSQLLGEEFYLLLVLQRLSCGLIFLSLECALHLLKWNEIKLQTLHLRFKGFTLMMREYFYWSLWVKSLYALVVSLPHLTLNFLEPKLLWMKHLLRLSFLGC